jgi:hypothetical protein
VQRIRKESENFLSPNVNTVPRRRESDRPRNENPTSDGTSQRNAANQVKIANFNSLILCFVCSQKIKIYRLPQYTNQSAIPGSIANENKSLLLAAGKYLK